MVEISVIVPLFNEKENLEALCSSLREVLSGTNKEYEVILVDDCSTDGSFELLETLSKSDSHIKVIQFRVNFGQTAALMAGIDAARGKTIVTMDGDLQNDPKDIPAMLAKMDEGFEMVNGWRRNRQDPTLRVLPSMIANRMIRYLSGVPIHDFGCTLKAFQRDLVKDLRLYGEMHRFIPIFMSWEGARITELEVTHHPRTAGVSKYGFGRIFKVILDLITIKFLESYSTKPNYVFGGIGLLFSILGISLGLVGVYFHVERAGLMGGIFLVMGIQFLLMGILAEIVIRSYHETSKKPIYKIRRKLNLE